MPDTKNTQAKDNGKKIFQPNRISWSYLYLGKDDLTQIKENKSKVVFKLNQIVGEIQFNITILYIGNQPPKNKDVAKLHIKIIFAYSPKKNKAKPIAEYSTLYPATNSASASGKSKGALFVSANIEI